MTKKTERRVPDWAWTGMVGAGFCLLVVCAVAVFFSYIAAIAYADPVWLWVAIPGTLAVGFTAGVLAEAI